MTDMQNIIEESFQQYAGAVLQSRALVDVRDCLKPSARQIFYCLYTDKFLPDKPFKKTLKAIGSIARMYIHGDSSAEGVIMRAGQPFAMRYPIIEVEGNAGNLMMSGNWAATRYTASRVSEYGTTLFKDIEKNTINDWRDNYDETEQYPSVLPTKGFYNIVNGSMGIGIGAASSIPQFNIKEVNQALITLLKNPNCSFDEIYCAPDFATGAILLNEEEIKESLKNGTGPACKLRSVVEYDKNERCLIVKEIPYSVYTNTICGELEAICCDEVDRGIERFNDLTGVSPMIKIYLKRSANPDKVLKYLYKNTSLQSYYSVNMTMLDNGRFPKVFTWKDALQAHIDHEKIVYRRGFEFDLNKIKYRIHIIDGILICLANIDEVVHIIKSAESVNDAQKALIKTFLLDEEQSKAILDMKLARLAHLEVEKLVNEKKELEDNAQQIEYILNNEDAFNNELISGWEKTAKKFGDERRTKILNIETVDEDPVEIRSLQVYLTNKNNVFINETSTLYTQKRGGVGNKFKMETGEYVITSKQVDSNEQLLFFTNVGNVYHASAGYFTVGDKTSLYSVIPIKDWENVCAMTATSKSNAKEFICFVTKQGMIKKTLLSEYNTNRQVGLKALNLNPGDEIVSVLFVDNERIGMVTETGNFVMINSTDIRAIGRTATGVHGIKLNDGDYVSNAHTIAKDVTFIASISGNGLFKQTAAKEFSVQNPNTKGVRIQKIADGDYIADFLPISTDCDIIIASTSQVIKLTTKDIPKLGRMTLGNKSLKLAEKDNVVKILAN